MKSEGHKGVDGSKPVHRFSLNKKIQIREQSFPMGVGNRGDLANFFEGGICQRLEEERDLT